MATQQTRSLARFMMAPSVVLLFIWMIVPLVFISVVAHFPTGLVLYWVTTNLWTVGQGLITRRLMPKTPLPTFGAKRTSRTEPPSRACP